MSEEDFKKANRISVKKLSWCKKNKFIKNWLFVLHSIKEKAKFHYSKYPIDMNNVDIDKILVSN